MTILLHVFIPCASQLQILSLKFLIDKLSEDWNKRGMLNFCGFTTGIRIFFLIQILLCLCNGIDCILYVVLVFVW
jgi:hypothetical protein